jgi:hypothetical protein
MPSHKTVAQQLPTRLKAKSATIQPEEKYERTSFCRFPKTYAKCPGNNSTSLTITLSAHKGVDLRHLAPELYQKQLFFDFFDRMS